MNIGGLSDQDRARIILDSRFDTGQCTMLHSLICVYYRDEDPVLAKNRIRCSVPQSEKFFFLLGGYF